MLKFLSTQNTMGSISDIHHQNKNNEAIRKPRFLCLHGFRTSGEILKKQVDKWPEPVKQRLDLVFPDGPFPAQGKSDVDGIFDPPYYEWFQFNKGAILSAALPGLQAQGLALTKVPKVKFLIIIGGAKLKSEYWAEKAYGSPIQCPSLHFLGKEDFLRPYGEDLLKSVVDPLVIHHPKGHTVPRIDDQALPTMLSFIDRIQKMISEDEENKTSAQGTLACTEISIL
ncbi:hypothetical protein KSS87_002161 [Heliosperma pusillum]|nr:hypothetical protein KSS87_023291 [Heliosperma pusillum]KAH9612506.1 hypothetical protein KSS87_002161 [Heliosperma pusillum]